MHIIYFWPLVQVQIDALNFYYIYIYIKEWLLLLLDRYFKFGFEMDILDMVKIWICSFNWTILIFILFCTNLIYLFIF